MSDPSTKVCIDTGPLTVTVEAPGVDLDVAAAKALAIYEAVWRPDMRNGGAAGLGFTAERSGQ